ncbi:MAG: GNAT family N-acetyltransferase [Clostridia bacterium]|nr:GNAT family N-acetyltransferase [Clostridia bacterium]
MKTGKSTDWETFGFTVREVDGAEEKQKIARSVLESLTDWFGNPEAREDYIMKSGGWPMVAAFDGKDAVGFLCLKETGKATAEVAVMGVRREFHRKGIGRELFRMAKQIVKEKGYSFLQVKTVALGMYEDYDRTNRFYQSLGFQEFEVIPELWGEENPCQIYVMALKGPDPEKE